MHFWTPTIIFPLVLVMSIFGLCQMLDWSSQNNQSLLAPGKGSLLITQQSLIATTEHDTPRKYISKSLVTAGTALSVQEGLHCLMMPFGAGHWIAHHFQNLQQQTPQIKWMKLWMFVFVHKQNIQEKSPRPLSRSF